MTTDNEQRSVSVLLSILETDRTYQDMTDAEIQSVIDYKVQESYSQGRIDLQREEYSRYNNEMVEATQDALQNQQEMLQSIIDRASYPILKRVQYG